MPLTRLIRAPLILKHPASITFIMSLFFRGIARFGSIASCVLVLNGCTDDSGEAHTQTELATTNQIIVQLKPDPLRNSYAMLSAELQQQLSQSAGVKLQAVRVNGSGAQIMRLPAEMSNHSVTGIARRLAERKDVQWAEPDTRYRALLIPNDPEFSQHWHLREAAASAGGAGLPDAWDISTGAAELVVAVVDTGVLPHAELGNRLLKGYDFISTADSARDGDGRDVDATDQGDWISDTEAALYGQAAGSSSSWHGTHVAGTIAASGNNGRQVTGINWQSKILPVRVLGKGGGYLSDIADGIRWSAGGSVPGVPQNTTPARVINLSLGGASPACPRSYQAAIDYALAQNTVVVVAAGNEQNNAAENTPANCQGVISVAAVAPSGARAYYSSWGTSVTIAAPGGDQKYERGVLSLGDGGETSPLFDNGTMELQGTSMAAPHIAGIVSLMLSVNPALTPKQVSDILQATARPFPTGTRSNCSTSLCGAGIVNAASAVKAAATGATGIVNGRPQSGWWWNPSEGGRGFALEIRDSKLFFGGFLYDAKGKASWYVSGPTPMQDAMNYRGSLLSYRDVQTLNGNYRSPQSQNEIGTLDIQFHDATHATMTWPGGQIAIQRFEITPGGLNSTSTNFAPETGWWWNANESGRGFAIEVQAGHLFMTGFMYDDAGDPMWYLSSGNLNGRQYEGNWSQYQGGQSMGGNYRTPSVLNANIGKVKIDFQDTTHATLSLPNGNQITLERFHLGFFSPGVEVSENKEKTSKLIGIWNFEYTIISHWQDYYLFNNIRERTDQPGTYFVLGLDEYDDPIVGAYDPELGMYLVLDQGYLTNQVFVFDLVGDGQVSGCYYQVDLSDDSWSDCYAMNGTRLFDVTPLALAQRRKRDNTEKGSRSTQLAAEILQKQAGLKRIAAIQSHSNGWRIRAAVNQLRNKAPRQMQMK
ncbi:MAG: S8 family peptidase [Candidatus Competibacteraceae bacterium]